MSHYLKCILFTAGIYDSMILKISIFMGQIFYLVLKNDYVLYMNNCETLISCWGKNLFIYLTM